MERGVGLMVEEIEISNQYQRDQEDEDKEYDN